MDHSSPTTERSLGFLFQEVAMPGSTSVAYRIRPFCEGNCGLQPDVEEQRVVRIRGDEGNVEGTDPEQLIST